MFLEDQVCYWKIRHVTGRPGMLLEDQACYWKTRYVTGLLVNKTYTSVLGIK